MKFGIMYAVILFSSLAFGGNGIERFVPIDFEKAADMSYRSKEKIQKYIQSRCQPAASTASGLSVKLVDLDSVHVDQGIVDEIYTVHVIFHGWDQYEHELAVFKVTDYAGANPAVEWVQIEQIETSVENLCK